MSDYSLPRIKENALPEATSIDKVRVLDDAGKSVWVEKENLPVTQAQVIDLTGDLAFKADKATQIAAGAGLTGGGDISKNRTINVASADDGITVNADNIKLNIVNNLVTTSATRALSATQGKKLQDEKEALSNKSTNVTTDAASNTKYPSVKAVKTYVDSAAVTTDNVSQNIEEDTSSTIKVPSVSAVEDYLRDVLIKQVTWSVPLMQNQSNPEWGVTGNVAAWEVYKSRIGRYLMTSDGKAAKLDPTDSSVYADGTALNEEAGNVMTYVPALYYLVIPGATYPTLYCSESPIAGGHYIPASWIGAYKGTMDGTKLISRSGISPAGNRNISAFWAAAQVNGTDWGITDYNHRRLMMLLCLSEYGNPNIQLKLGYGVGGSVQVDLWAQAATLLTGATKTMGDASGKIDISLTGGTGCSRVNFFGIEDPYGWQWEMIQNVYFGSSSNAGQTGSEVFIYEGNRMPSAGELTTHPDGAYRQLVRPTAGSYVQRMLLGEYFDLIPELVSSSADSVTYWCDYFYSNTTGQLLLCGGAAIHGPRAGLGSAASINDFSTSYASFGARLAYFGNYELMTGAELVATL